MTRRGALATIVYDPATEMDLGDGQPVHATVTLERNAVPDAVLPGIEAAGVPGVVISCHLQARLDASSDEFGIDDRDWVTRSLLTTNRVDWSWNVEPRVGGRHALTLYVRPIAVLETRATAAAGTVDESDAVVQVYETQVDVHVPWNERPEELMARMASTLNVAEGLVKALTALIIAVAGLGAAVLAVRRRRSRRAADTRGPPN